MFEFCICLNWIICDSWDLSWKPHRYLFILKLTSEFREIKWSPGFGLQSNYKGTSLECHHHTTNHELFDERIKPIHVIKLPVGCLPHGFTMKNSSLWTTSLSVLLSLNLCCTATCIYFESRTLSSKNVFTLLKQDLLWSRCQYSDLENICSSISM